MPISEKTKTNLSISTLTIVVVFSITTAFALGVKQSNIENRVDNVENYVETHKDDCAQKDLEFRTLKREILDRLIRIEESTDFLKDQIKERGRPTPSSDYPIVDAH